MSQRTRKMSIISGPLSVVMGLYLLCGLSPLFAAGPQLPPKAQFKVFLLIGQSNMAGRGKVEEQDKTPHPRILMLNKADQWLPAVDPLHFDKPAIAGVGPGSGFGKAIAEANPAWTIGLVPCAVGGTSIDEWKKGGKLYTEAVRRAKLALKHGELAGILWHQGESDSAPEKIQLYPQKAATLFAELRKDLDSPHAPLVVGELGPFLGARAEQFNAMLQKLPDTIPHCAVASSKDLKDKGDRLHFDAPSAREFGRRYAAAWAAFARKP